MREDMIPMTMVDKLKEAITQVANDMRATNSPFDEITVNAFEDKIDGALNSILESGHVYMEKDKVTGNPVQNMTKCANCGGMISFGDSFCKHCGSNIRLFLR